MLHGTGSGTNADKRKKTRHGGRYGRSLSIISESKRKAIFPNEKLTPAYIVLKTYTKEPIEVMGTLNVRVQYEGQFTVLHSPPIWSSLCPCYLSKDNGYNITGLTKRHLLYR